MAKENKILTSLKMPQDFDEWIKENSVRIYDGKGFWRDDPKKAILKIIKFNVEQGTLKLPNQDTDENQ